MSIRPHVVVLGSGFGGLETCFHLRHQLGDGVRLTLISNSDHFLFKPNTIYIPFGESPDHLRLKLDQPLRQQDIEFVHRAVRDIDPVAQKVHVSLEDIPYDYLVVATGATTRPDEIPGLKEHAITLWTAEEMLRLRDGLQRIVELARGGGRPTVLYLVPPNNKCPGPLYEMLLMTDTWLRRQQVRESVPLVLTTVEEGYLQAFGPRLNTLVTDEFHERGIEGHKGYVVSEITPAEVIYQNGDRIAYDLLVSFPPFVAARSYPLLPHDARGFLPVEPDSRCVRGQANVFAVGDAADFPIKQAYLALLQADAAADHIAADIQSRPATVRFEPTNLYIIEEMNRATFAQVPLSDTGDPLLPVATEPAGDPRYKVGVSPIWRLGKKFMGLYLPWRFGHGQPFHAGLTGGAIDVSLKVMSRLFAR